MKVLIASATWMEIARLVQELGNAGDASAEEQPLRLNHGLMRIDLMVTGVGQTAMAWSLGRILALEHYDLGINLGICGSFRDHLTPGTVVEVINDRFADLGAEDGDRFLDIFELKLARSQAEPFIGGRIERVDGIRPACLDQLHGASGITVATAHGEARSIARVREKYDPDIESMEGAAFFYGCRKTGLPCIQIRAVSNPVVTRDRDSWNIPLAINHLNSFAHRLIAQIGEMHLAQKT
jgi:futalosine hydrolase